MHNSALGEVDIEFHGGKSLEKMDSRVAMPIDPQGTLFALWFGMIPDQ